MNADDPMRGEGAMDMEQDPETGEWKMKDESFWDFFTHFFEQKGEEIEREEAEQEQGLVRWERERKAAQEATRTNWGVIGGGAALAAGGIAFATGKVLKLALLGWTIDGSGNIRKDTATLGAFEKAYGAMKNNEGIFPAIGKGMGMAA